MSASNLDDLRALLAALGAPISADSRLNEDALERKLRLAIGYSQHMSEWSKMMPVNPVQLPVWQISARMPFTANAFSRISIAEALKIGREEVEGGSAHTGFPVFENALVDIRQTLMSLVQHYEEGRRVAFLQYQNQRPSIALRMLGLYTLDTEIPLMSLIYEDTNTTGEATSDKMALFNRTQVHGAGTAQVICTLQELALIRRLLRANSAKVAPEYEASLAPDQRGFQRSFFVPVGPLNSVQIGKITHNSGCTVCGAADAKGCSGCKIERYCSSACQTAHWKDHKAACRHMQGGTWTDFIFTDAPSFNGQKLFMSTINASSAVTKIMRTKVHGGDGDIDPPPNKHGDRAFLIKIQRLKDASSLELPPSHVVYDRLRTLHCCLEPDSNATSWPAFEEQLPPAMMNVKMYCWAKRTGPWNLSICLDRHPSGAEKPSW